MTSTAPPLSPTQPNGSGTNHQHQQQQQQPSTSAPRNGPVTSSYPPPPSANYNYAYPPPPSGYPSAYPRPAAGYSQPAPYGYPRAGYPQPSPGPSRSASNGLSSLLHPDGPKQEPNSPNSTPLSLPQIQSDKPSPAPAQPQPAQPNPSLTSTTERGPTPPMPLDPALAEPEPDLPVNLPPPGAPTSQPKKRPFDDLLGATASLSANEMQHDRPNPAEQRDGQVTDENGDMLAFIVKKAVQMTNKAKLSAEAEEDDGQDKANGGPVKKFPCPHQLCGRKFARSWNLQAHLKSHLGIRDFSCPECGKLFSRKHDCTRHCIAIHLYNKDGTKPVPDGSAPATAPAPGPVPAQQQQQHHIPPPQQQQQQPQPQVHHQQLPIDPNADLAVGGPAQ